MYVQICEIKNKIIFSFDVVSKYLIINSVSLLTGNIEFNGCTFIEFIRSPTTQFDRSTSPYDDIDSQFIEDTHLFIHL